MRTTAPHRESLEEVVIRFAGDSGDGIQLTGSQFTNTAAMFGNDLGTFPDFPAEIRAPAGSLAGVSAFQLHISSHDIHTPGDQCDVLVVMNPAALKVNIARLKPNAIIIADISSFTARDLQLAGYEENPLKNHSLDAFQVFEVDISGLTREALKELGLTAKAAERCKNFFSLGLIYWMFNREVSLTEKWITEKFAKSPDIVRANITALKAGYNYGEATEVFATIYEVKPAHFPPGKYRNIMGNTATALGLVTAANKAGLQLFYGAYPITPASDILHELARHKHFNVKTFQAEDEIAAICAAIGAAFAGALAVTSTAGPGMCLKAEAMGLAVSVELPLVICDIQRGGPSTGLPTKTEQADLLMAMYGRHGESPLPIVAASRPADCFDTVYEACRLAVKYMTPVIFLSDGYIGNGAEPWLIPDPDKLEPLPFHFRTELNGGFKPFQRDETTLARPWAIPGTPGLEHRVGGLEKQDVTGNVSYDTKNHEVMSLLRADKIARIANDIAPVEVFGPADGDLLVLGWGGTFGSLRTAVEHMQARGRKVAHAHLRHLNPFPKNLGEVLGRYKHVLVPEINLGQLVRMVRDRYVVPAVGLSKIQGLPFNVGEIEAKIEELLGGGNGNG